MGTSVLKVVLKKIFDSIFDFQEIKWKESLSFTLSTLRVKNHILSKYENFSDWKLIGVEIEQLDFESTIEKIMMLDDDIGIIRLKKVKIGFVEGQSNMKDTVWFDVLSSSLVQMELKDIDPESSDSFEQCLENKIFNKIFKEFHIIDLETIFILSNNLELHVTIQRLFRENYILTVFETRIFLIVAYRCRYKVLDIQSIKISENEMFIDHVSLSIGKNTEMNTFLKLINYLSLLRAINNDNYSPNLCIRIEKLAIIFQSLEIQFLIDNILLDIPNVLINDLSLTTLDLKKNSKLLFHSLNICFQESNWKTMSLDIETVKFHSALKFYKIIEYLLLSNGKNDSTLLIMNHFDKLKVVINLNNFEIFEENLHIDLNAIAIQIQDGIIRFSLEKMIYSNNDYEIMKADKLEIHISEKTEIFTCNESGNFDTSCQEQTVYEDMIMYCHDISEFSNNVNFIIF